MNHCFKTMLPLLVLAYCSASVILGQALAEYPWRGSDAEYGIISTENAELIKDGSNVYLIENKPGYKSYYGNGIGANWNLKTGLKASGDNRYLHHTPQLGFHLVQGKANALHWEYEVLKEGKAKIFTETTDGKQYVKQSAKFVEAKNKKGEAFKLFLLELDPKDGTLFDFEGSSK